MIPIKNCELSENKHLIQKSKKQIKPNHQSLEVDCILSGINVTYLILQRLWVTSGPGTANSLWASLGSPELMGPDWIWCPTSHQVVVIFVIFVSVLSLLPKKEFSYISHCPLLKTKTFFSSNAVLLNSLYFRDF
uniref:Uncharacterized protein n=1 Tax=Myotis myotis TaxID=51298 RepID=A0A7J7VZ80_MYOMY|nr:hypothetical protein mMyoMyo1_012326 [Myotis myotis]